MVIDQGGETEDREDVMIGHLVNLDHSYYTQYMSIKYTADSILFMDCVFDLFVWIVDR